MGLFDMFKKKTPLPKATICMTAYEPPPAELDEQRKQEIQRIKNIRDLSYPSENGLRPHEILMLSYAPNYLVGNNNFSKFWYYQFAVEDPKRLLDSLLNRGFLRIATAEESLPSLKVAELKDILSRKNITAKGKKSNLIKSVSENFTEKELNSLVSERNYKLTALGEKELDNNEYVIYFGGERKYDLTVWDMNKMIQNYPHKLYRDKIWANLNEGIYNALNHLKSTRDLSQYCKDVSSTQYMMAEFLLEENKHYKDAISKITLGLYYDVYYNNVLSYKMLNEINKKIQIEDQPSYDVDGLIYRAKEIKKSMMSGCLLDEQVLSIIQKAISNKNIIPYNIDKRYNITRISLSDNEFVQFVQALYKNDDVLIKEFKNKIEKDIKRDKTPVYK